MNIQTEYYELSPLNEIFRLVKISASQVRQFQFLELTGADFFTIRSPVSATDGPLLVTGH